MLLSDYCQFREISLILIVALSITFSIKHLLRQKSSVIRPNLPKQFSNNFEIDMENNILRNNFRKDMVRKTCEKYLKQHPSEMVNMSRYTTLALQKNLLSLESVTQDILRPIHQGKIISCVSPKTGTTSWQAAFIALQKNKSTKNATENETYGVLPRYSGLVEKVGKYKDEERRNEGYMQLGEKLFVNGESTKIINVRHPLSRLYSCWGDKFVFWDRNDT